MLLRGLPPRSWAGFTLVGDPAVLVPLHIPGATIPPMAIAAAAGLLAAAGFLVARGRRRRAMAA